MFQTRGVGGYRKSIKCPRDTYPESRSPSILFYEENMKHETRNTAQINLDAKPAPPPHNPEKFISLVPRDE